MPSEIKWSEVILPLPTPVFQMVKDIFTWLKCLILFSYQRNWPRQGHAFMSPRKIGLYEQEKVKCNCWPTFRDWAKKLKKQFQERKGWTESTHLQILSCALGDEQSSAESKFFSEEMSLCRPLLPPFASHSGPCCQAGQPPAEPCTVCFPYTHPHTTCGMTVCVCVCVAAKRDQLT